MLDFSNSLEGTLVLQKSLDYENVKQFKIIIRAQVREIYSLESIYNLFSGQPQCMYIYRYESIKTNLLVFVISSFLFIIIKRFSLAHKDQGQPPLYSEASVTVQVLDADDQNPIFGQSRYWAHLPQPAQQVIIIITNNIFITLCLTFFSFNV